MAEKKTGLSRSLIIHPGETISDVLEEREITWEVLAEKANVPMEYVRSVISGKSDISPGLALALERVVNVPRSFWLNLQANYNAELAEYEKELKDHFVYSPEMPDTATG